MAYDAQDHRRVENAVRGELREDLRRCMPSRMRSDAAAYCVVGRCMLPVPARGRTSSAHAVLRALRRMRFQWGNPARVASNGWLS